MNRFNCLLAMVSILFLFACGEGPDQETRSDMMYLPVTPEMREAVEPEPDPVPQRGVRTDDGSMPIDDDGNLWDGHVEVIQTNDEDNDPRVRLRLPQDASGTHGYMDISGTWEEDTFVTDAVVFGTCDQEIWLARFYLTLPDTLVMRLYVEREPLGEHVVQAELISWLTLSYRDGTYVSRLYEATNLFGPGAAGVMAYFECEQASVGHGPKFGPLYDGCHFGSRGC